MNAVARDFDLGLFRGAGLRVEHPQIAAQLIHDLPVIAAARPTHVPGFAVRHLRRGVFREIVAEEVEGAVAVGHEPHFVANPHRVALGARRVGNGSDRARREVKHVEILSPPTLVALPSPKVAGERRVDRLRPIRRHVSPAGHRHGQRRRHPAGRGDVVEAGVGQIPSRAHRAEEDGAAVARPSVDLIVESPPLGKRSSSRIPGQLPRLAAAGRHHVDLLIAVVLSGEGDPLPVRRKLGEQLEAGMGRQPHRHTTFGAGRPQIAAVTEDQPVARDIGETQQSGLGRENGRNQDGHQRQYCSTTHPGRSLESPALSMGASGSADHQIRPLPMPPRPRPLKECSSQMH